MCLFVLGYLAPCPLGGSMLTMLTSVRFSFFFWVWIMLHFTDTTFWHNIHYRFTLTLLPPFGHSEQCRAHRPCRLGSGPDTERWNCRITVPLSSCPGCTVFHAHQQLVRSPAPPSRLPAALSSQPRPNGCKAICISSLVRGDSLSCAYWPLVYLWRTVSSGPLSVS